MRGFTAHESAIECPQGFARTQAPSLNPMSTVVDTRAGFAIESALFKYHASCYLTHSTIEAIRQAVKLPLLRKDFIIDARQILEAVEWGADAILLIAAILDDAQLRHFHSLATEAGLNVLKSGGNAIDAAVAVGFTLGVVDSHNSGIGGGCFMLIRLANGKFVAIDGREMALLDRIVELAHSDEFRLDMAFKDGGRAHVFASWLHPFKEHRLVVVGEKAMAVFEDSLAGPEKLRLYRHAIDTSGRAPEPKKAEGEPIPYPATEPLKNECAHFLACCEGKIHPRTDAAEAIAVLKVLKAAG
mgnify:CR=1 FL=1